MVAIDLSSDSLTHYLNEIGQHDVLTREEEKKLFQRLERGDERARERLVQCNLRFVVKVASQFRGRGMSLGDLIQEGNIGLLEVMDKFDWRRGFRFSTYAAFWIRQAIQRSLLKGGSTVRLPNRKVRLLGHLRRHIEEFQGEHHRDPSLEELADIVDMTPEALTEVLRWREGVLSLDAPVDENGAQLAEMVSDDPEFNPRAHAIGAERRNRVEESLDTLSDRERSVMRYRFGFETGSSLSLRHTSLHLGLSQEGVRRLERVALTKLRRRAENLELAALA